MNVLKSMNATQFTYAWYANLLRQLKKAYAICDYENYTQSSRCVILRHDVDFSVEKAKTLAELEYKNGIKSTYFFLMTSDFYNICSKHSRTAIKEIWKMGHQIGLHFDEAAYDSSVGNNVFELVKEEVERMKNILQMDIRSVSMHRPSPETLTANYDWNGIINSYGNTFFRDFKYVSDSRRNWRENIEEIIASEEYSKLHILTHPFWYNVHPISLKQSVLSYINAGSLDRYSIVKENITDIDSILDLSEVLQ